MKREVIRFFVMQVLENAVYKWFYPGQQQLHQTVTLESGSF